MVSEVARNLGINANLLSRRKSELARPAEAREAESRDRQELSRLKKESRRLLMEQETLKKRRPSLRTNWTTTPVHPAA